MGVSLGKTLQSPCLELVKTRKDMNDVSCPGDITEIMLKAAYSTIQSIHPVISSKTALTHYHIHVFPSSISKEDMGLENFVASWNMLVCFLSYHS